MQDLCVPNPRNGLDHADHTDLTRQHELAQLTQITDKSALEYLDDEAGMGDLCRGVEVSGENVFFVFVGRERE